MSFDYKPVSLEEYNQSLRDTVNAYYTHAMNAPEMSNEEALQTTGEMSEKYLEAVEEFQESTGEITSVDHDGLDDGLDDGEGCDGGMDP